MVDSILTTIKKLIGFEEEYTQFDTDIIININSAFMRLMVLGIGPKTGFKVTGKENTWSSFIAGRTDIEDVKTYIYLKTRLTFDPPTSGPLISAIKDQITELEWLFTIK